MSIKNLKEFGEEASFLSQLTLPSPSPSPCPEKPGERRYKVKITLFDLFQGLPSLS
jgi:hypothetical protein